MNHSDGKDPQDRRPAVNPSPEAIERRKARDRAKSKKRRAEARVARLAAAKGGSVLTVARSRAWRIGPVGPALSKRELREMLAVAAANTARMI